jgi:hypothetical protein
VCVFLRCTLSFPSPSHQVFDISSHLMDAAAAIVDDSFWRCFALSPAESWNWNVYLFPLWCLGVLLRYLVLFPLRYCSASALHTHTHTTHTHTQHTHTHKTHTHTQSCPLVGCMYAAVLRSLV